MLCFSVGWIWFRWHPGVSRYVFNLTLQWTHNRHNRKIYFRSCPDSEIYTVQLEFPAYTKAHLTHLTPSSILRKVLQSDRLAVCRSLLPRPPLYFWILELSIDDVFVKKTLKIHLHFWSFRERSFFSEGTVSTFAVVGVSAPSERLFVRTVRLERL